MFALPAPLLFFMICTFDQPEQASTRIWMYVFPFLSVGVIDPVVSDDIVSRRAYQFCSFCFNKALIVVLSLQGSHEFRLCVLLKLSICLIASGNSARNHAINFLCVWLNVSFPCLSRISGHNFGPLLFSTFFQSSDESELFFGKSNCAPSK